MYNQAIKFTHFVRRTSFHSAAYGGRYAKPEKVYDGVQSMLQSFEETEQGLAFLVAELKSHQ